MHSEDRSRLAHKLTYAVQHPDRIVGYARRRGRDTWLWLTTRDHVQYYRAVMRSDAARSSDGAVGSKSREAWLRVGQLQFDYLIKHGLKPDMRLLEIGCGNLRAGRLFIDYLDSGNYYGTDISPDILLAAHETVGAYGLQRKLPYLGLVRDMRLEFLPDDHFDVVHAHSVFSHSPLPVIEECLRHIGRVMVPGGMFDFTYDATAGTEHQVLREDFYYRTETLLDLARGYGFEAQYMADWEQTGHEQSKIRLIRPA